MEQYIDAILTTLLIFSVVATSFAFFYELSPKIRAEFLLKKQMSEIHETANMLNFLSHLYYNSSIQVELRDIQIKCLPNGVLFILDKECPGKFIYGNVTYFNNKTAVLGNQIFTEVYPNLYYGCIGKIAFLYKYPKVKNCSIDCKGYCTLTFIKTEQGLVIK